MSDVPRQGRCERGEVGKGKEPAVCEREREGEEGEDDGEKTTRRACMHTRKR